LWFDLPEKLKDVIELYWKMRGEGKTSVGISAILFPLSLPNFPMAAPIDPTSSSWLAARGWFSSRGHDHPVWVRLAGGRIAEISEKAPEGGSNLEARGYLLPLLADTHVHVYMEPWPVNPAQRARPGSGDFESEVQVAMARVDRALAEGVGLLRDMGDPSGINLEVKRRLAARGHAAPELQVTGTGFHRPKPYGRFLGVAREAVAEILAGIDALHATGQLDCVKVVTTGIVDFAGARMNQPPQYTLQELSQVVAHAHALGYRVASHCSGQDGIDINLDAGVDFIEHAYFTREDQAARMASAGAYWTPTIAPVRVQGRHPEADWEPAVRSSIETILADHGARLRYGAACGARILVGTDAGCPGVSMGAGLRIELAGLVEAGFTPADALRMATVDAAAALRPRRYRPTIEVGEAATFALYEKCPWHDIAALDSLLEVRVDGRVI